MEFENFYLPRRSFSEPAPIVLAAAELLSAATDAHLEMKRDVAAKLFAKANDPAIFTWTQTIMGARDPYVIREREVANMPPRLPKTELKQPRNPSTDLKRRLIERDGYHCRFCTMPVIDERVRRLAEQTYPSAIPWTGAKDRGKHSAFFCMWLQYDHLVPHSRGGETSLENMVITCAPCNYGRWYNTIEEVGLLDPRLHPVTKTSWDGLERFAKKKGCR